MKRCVGWTVAVVLVLSLLAAPMASAQVARADGPSSWADALFGWLVGLAEGSPDAPAGVADAPSESAGETGPDIDPGG